MSYRFADSLRKGSITSWSCSQAVSKPVWHIPLLCVQWKTADSGQRNCPKYVVFYSKNKFEKLVHLIGFIIRIYHDARSPKCQYTYMNCMHFNLTLQYLIALWWSKTTETCSYTEIKKSSWGSTDRKPFCFDTLLSTTPKSLIALMDRNMLQRSWRYYDVLLTVHLSIFISVIHQLDAQNFCFTIS